MNNRTASKSGYAIVSLRHPAGYSYEGEIEVRGPWVHMTAAKRRVGWRDEVDYRLAGDMTWPYGTIDSIRWIRVA